MSTANRAIDVFLSHTHHDSELAKVVRGMMEEGGLSVFSVEDLHPGRNIADSIRNAIAEARAFVALLTPTSVHSASLAVEFGGAWVRNKPVYLLTDNLGAKDVPAYLKSQRTISVAKVPEVVAEIVRSSLPLTDLQRDSLIRIYGEIGVPSDRLTSDSASLDELTRRFNEDTNLRVSSDRLLETIIRLRKQGKLRSRTDRVGKTG